MVLSNGVFLHLCVFVCNIVYLFLCWVGLSLNSEVCFLSPINVVFFFNFSIQVCYYLFLFV